MKKTFGRTILLTCLAALALSVPALADGLHSDNYLEGVGALGINVQYGPGFAGNSASAAGKTGTLSYPRTTNADLAQELGGGFIRVLANEGNTSQQLSIVVKSSDGKVIVVDGGVEQDAEHLYRILKENGGKVDAWLLTHPQTDHAGGLYAMLRDHKDIDIKGIYYRFFEYEWYQAVDPGEIGMLYHLMQVFAEYPQDRLHKEIRRNEVYTLSPNLSFRVMNDPLKSEGNFAVNGSCEMYDITVNGKHLIVLGDMSEEVGNRHYANGVLDGLTCDYLQISHHGQCGVGETFYKVCNPRNCLWSSPSWLYYADRNNSKGYRTWETKEWFSRMNVENHYCTAEGDIIIR